jgi:pimeloyl-ACP methyl ester carboxylesterase
MTKDAMVTTPQTVTSTDGTTIAYEKVGSGPALVLVDGALCSRDFGPCRSMANYLADRYTVYFYDRRGRGESGDTRPYAPEREFEDLQAVIDAAGGTAFVLGYSSGGALALRAAAAGVTMAKVVSYEAPWVGVTKVKGATPDYIADLEALLAKGDNGGAVGYFMVTMVGGPSYLPIMMKLMPKVFRQLKAAAPTIPNDAKIMGDWSAPAEELGTISIPALIVGGSKAKPNMTAAVKAAADAVPGSIHKTLPGQTHQVQDKALAPELIAFLEAS